MSKRPTKITTYVVTATITLEEHLDSSWHTPFTAAQAKALVAEISPHKGWEITGGAYTAQITKVRTAKVATMTLNTEVHS